MPADVLRDFRTLCSRADDLAKHTVWPVRLSAVHLRTAEYKIGILIVRTRRTPIEQRSRQFRCHRYSTARGFRFKRAYMRIDNGTYRSNLASVEVNVFPLER